MILRPALFLFCLLGMLQPLHARLGETEAQLVARYGEAEKPKSKDPEIVDLTFHSDGWLIKAQIYQGVCQYISYLKSPYYEGFEEARDKLLEVNAQGSTWSLKKKNQSLFMPSSLSHIYVRDDGKALAEIPKQGFIRAEFYTPTWVEYGKAREAAKRKPGPLPNF